MSYYWFNRQELLLKANKKYDNAGKEKAAEYYQASKDVIKEKTNSQSEKRTERRTKRV